MEKNFGHIRSTLDETIAKSLILYRVYEWTNRVAEKNQTEIPTLDRNVSFVHKQMSIMPNGMFKVFLMTPKHTYTHTHTLAHVQLTLCGNHQSVGQLKRCVLYAKTLVLFLSELSMIFSICEKKIDFRIKLIGLIQV